MIMIMIMIMMATEIEGFWTCSDKFWQGKFGRGR
jgi:hypothetical protein